MTKIEQIEHFQTHVHRFSLLMPIGDSHHHTLYIMYASRFKSPKNHLSTSAWEQLCLHSQQCLSRLFFTSEFWRWAQVDARVGLRKQTFSFLHWQQIHLWIPVSFPLNRAACLGPQEQPPPPTKTYHLVGKGWRRKDEWKTFEIITIDTESLWQISSRAITRR